MNLPQVFQPKEQMELSTTSSGNTNQKSVYRGVKIGLVAESLVLCVFDSSLFPCYNVRQVSHLNLNNMSLVYKVIGES